MIKQLRTFKEQFVNLTLYYRLRGHKWRIQKSNLCDSNLDVKNLSVTYTPQHIANYFLGKAESEGIPMSQLKLMKMVYIAYGWYIALTDDRLFDEPIEAWQHGPVIESLYHEFKHFKNRPISEFALEMNMDTFSVTIPQVPQEDKVAHLILSKVWISYKRFNAWALRNKTHELGGPWHRVYQDGVRGIELEDSDIKEHYVKKIGQYLEVAKIRTEAAVASL